MAGEWVAVRLGDVIDLQTGFPFRSDRYIEDDTAPRLLRGDNVGQGTLRWGGVKRWSQDAVEDLSQYWLREGDIILAMDRPWIEAGLKYASIRASDLPALLVQRVARLRGAARLDTGFLKYVIGSRAFTEYVLAVQTGTAVPHISGSQIESFEFTLPPLPEQRAIAHILRTLDDKIELNRRMNETLKAMARALFKSWFVDFDPVRAKSKGRDPGLPKPFADLFPASFEDSALGEIPKGWAVEPLSEITMVITKGTTPTHSDTATADQADLGINYVRVNAIDEDGAVLFDKLTTIPESVHLGVLKRSVLQLNDVLYTIAGTIGRTAIVDESLLPANANQAVAIVRSKQAIPATFLVMTMREAAFRQELHSNIVQAVQANLSLGVLSRARIVVPPKHTLPKLFMPIADTMKRVTSIRAESRTLAALRNTLLPKLISGELRVPVWQDVAGLVNGVGQKVAP